MKNKQLIISGGGDEKDTFNIDKVYFDLLKPYSKILYIPIALHQKDFLYEECYDWFSKVINLHCQEKEIDFTMHLDGDNITDLNIYNSIYIGGGNTFKLLDYIYDNNLETLLKDYISQGGLYYGGSAGGIIIGKNIDTVKEENINNSKYNNGLSLIKNYCIYCHYTEDADKKMEKFVKEYKNPVIAIPENMGIFVNDDDFKVVGDDSITLFDLDNKKVLAGNLVFKY